MRVLTFQHMRILGKCWLAEMSMLDLGLIKMWKLDTTRGFEDCITIDVKLLVHMLSCTNPRILNGTHVFPMANILACLPTSRRESIADYVFMNECDASTIK